MAVVGNIIVAPTLFFKCNYSRCFDIYPATNSANQPLMANLFSILVDYAIFAFMINLIREMIKDIEDIKEMIIKE
jgi:4-hydroxybenzoate polyprenyltransferase